jgi:predicted DNA-binding protein
MAMFERQKCNRLIYEFSIQRNVHRWDVIAAVDPAYVKQLKYRSLLTAKLDVAHRELIRLTEERNELREKLARKGTSLPKTTAQRVSDHIAKYVADIEEKDAKIEELRRAVDGNQPKVHSSIEENAFVHAKVVTRRGNYAKLKAQSVAAGRLRRDDPVWFLTEAPVDGILRRSQIDEAVTPGMETALEVRAKSMLNSASNSKKVTKPLKGTSAQTSPKKIVPPLQRSDGSP